MTLDLLLLLDLVVLGKCFTHNGNEHVEQMNNEEE